MKTLKGYYYQLHLYISIIKNSYREWHTCHSEHLLYVTISDKYFYHFMTFHVLFKNLCMEWVEYIQKSVFRDFIWLNMLQKVCFEGLISICVIQPEGYPLSQIYRSLTQLVESLFSVSEFWATLLILILFVGLVGKMLCQLKLVETNKQKNFY